MRIACGPQMISDPATTPAMARRSAMTGQTAVVTGGMGGLGKAMSIRLHDRGYAVVVTASPQNTGAECWRARMAANGRLLRAYTADAPESGFLQRCGAQK